MRLGLGAGGRSEQQIVLNAVRERMFREQETGTMDEKLAGQLIAYWQLKMGKRRTEEPREEGEWDLLEDGEKGIARENGGVGVFDVGYDHRLGRGRVLEKKKQK